MEHQEQWRIIVDRGDGPDTLIQESQDIDVVETRIGQMVLSMGIDQIVVYRNGEEYRRYLRAQAFYDQSVIEEYHDMYTDIRLTVQRAHPKITLTCPEESLPVGEINRALARLRQSAGLTLAQFPDIALHREEEGE